MLCTNIYIILTLTTQLQSSITVEAIAAALLPLLFLKSLKKSPSVGSFYETKFDIWVGFGLLGSLEFMNFIFVQGQMFVLCITSNQVFWTKFKIAQLLKQCNWGQCNCGGLLYNSVQGQIFMLCITPNRESSLQDLYIKTFAVSMAHSVKVDIVCATILPRGYQSVVFVCLIFMLAGFRALLEAFVLFFFSTWLL